jgi:hypothetical protein
MDEENNVPAGPAPEIIREAESQGWVPREKFRGSESDWVDADTFVKRGREILPILRRNNENLIRDLNATKEQLREFREAAEEFKRFQKESYERKVSDYEKRIAEIKESRAQAISDGDGAKVNALDDALDQAKEEIKEAKEAAKEAAKAPVTPSPAQEVVDPALQTWLSENEWFGTDRRLTAIANGIGESLRVEFPMLEGQEFLDKLNETLREEMPEKFGRKATPASRVESGSGRVSRAGSNPRSYDALPADAKAACDRFVKQKLMTREEYVRDFDWS